MILKRNRSDKGEGKGELKKRVQCHSWMPHEMNNFGFYIEYIMKLMYSALQKTFCNDIILKTL